MRHKSLRLPLAVLNQFENIYSRIPSIDCKGLCHDSCGMVPMTAFEWARMVARHGKVPGVRTVDDRDGKPWCPILTVDKKCEHYDQRPVICRLWGVVEGMPCVHGCKPAKYLTDAEGLAMIELAMNIGGGPVPDQMQIILNGVKSQE